MNDKANRVYSSFIRIRDFGRDHADEFAANSLGRQAFTTLDTIIAEFDGHAASQASGFGRQRLGTATHGEAREDLRDVIAAISRTAAVLTDEPGLEGKFSLPASDSDQALLSSARAFATDLTPFVTRFEAHELPGLVANLNAQIDALEEAIDEQASGTGDHVSSRAAIDDAIERGLNVRRTLDVIVQNKYEDNPVVMAEWTSARHIERAAVRKEKSTPAAPVTTASPATPQTPATPSAPAN
jgi:hypothetical protein